jgi:hypothetical protein
MPTVYCYPVKLTIADLIRAKSICSQTQFSHIINRLLTSLVLSVLWNIRPLFFACTSLLRRSVHTKKPRSDISQYRPHARSISHYQYAMLISLGSHCWATKQSHTSPYKGKLLILSKIYLVEFRISLSRNNCACCCFFLEYTYQTRSEVHILVQCNFYRYVSQKFSMLCTQGNFCCIL